MIFRHQPQGGKSLIKSILTIYLSFFRCSCIKAVLLQLKVDHRYPHPQTTERHALRNHLFEVSVERNQRVLYSRNSGLGVLSPQSDLNPSKRVRLDSILWTLNVIQFFDELNFTLVLVAISFYLFAVWTNFQVLIDC